MNERRKILMSGILGENIVLSELMVISPVIVCGDTLKNATALIYAFSTITFLAVLISSFVPQKLPYTVKVIIYALIAATVYIPVKFASKQLYPDARLRF